MKFPSNLNNDIEPFTYFTMGRPWGVYCNFVDNKPCTVKILFVKKGEGLSLQFHFKRDQLYVLLDDGFKITDGDKVYENVKSGTIFGFPREHIHRAEYYGDKKHGKILDIAMGENDENDIVRLKDFYKRENENKEKQND